MDHVVVLFLVFCAAFIIAVSNLYSYQQYISSPFSLYPLEHLLFVVFFMTVILTDVRSYFIVVLICISLMIRDVEYLFLCPLDICMSFFKCLFSCSHFKF